MYILDMHMLLMILQYSDSPNLLRLTGKILRMQDFETKYVLLHDPELGIRAGLITLQRLALEWVQQNILTLS